MNDDWIDKNELNQLVSRVGTQSPGPVYNQQSNDLFHDVQPAVLHRPQVLNPFSYASAPAQQPVQVTHDPRQAQPMQMQPLQQQHQQLMGQGQPMHPMQQQQGQAIPMQQVAQPIGEVASPFTIDLDEPEDPAERIAQLEIMLKELKEGREAAADPTAEEGAEECECVEDDTVANSRDRIPLDVEIDRYLSLKGRLILLAEILEEYVGMEEMMVVDQNGLSLFETPKVSVVENKATRFLQEIRKVYQDMDDKRNHSASQLVVGEGQWMLLMPTDGKGIQKKFVLKCLLPEPLDQPELYVLIELLNETMRPEKV